MNATTTVLSCIERLMVHVSVYHAEKEAGDWAERIGMTLARLRDNRISLTTACNILNRLTARVERYDFAHNADMGA